MDTPVAAPGPDGAVKAVGALLGIPAGARGLRFREKLLVLVVVVAVDVAVDAVEVAPGTFRLKPSIPDPEVPAVVAGAPRDSPVAADEAGAVASEAKSVGPALVVAAAGAGAAGCVVPAPVAAGVAGVKANPASVVGWAELAMEPMLKPEVPPVWDALPPVKEKPPGVVDGAEEVAVEPNTKPVGAVAWLEVTALEMALVRVLLPRLKPAGCAAAGVAAALPKLSFGVLIPKEKPVPPVAGVVVPKLNPEVCVAGVWVVRENRLVEGVLAAGWEGAPKVNPPVLDVEKENPVAGVVVAVFAVPNVNPPVGAPVPPKLNPLMAPGSGGGSYSSSQSRSSASSAPLGRSRLRSPLPPSLFSRGRCRLSFPQPWSPPLSPWCLSSPS